MSRKQSIKGPEAFCRVLASLRHGAKTRAQIIDEAEISRCAAYGVVDDLFSLGLVHVAGQSGRSLVFGFGPGVNALPYSAPPARLYAQVFGSVWDALDAGPVTLGECMEQTRRWHRAIATCIAAMRSHGLAHIAAWERRDIGPPMASYAIGSSPDASRPKRQPVSVVCKRWRDKKAAKDAQTAMLTAIRPDLLREAA